MIIINSDYWKAFNDVEWTDDLQIARQNRQQIVDRMGDQGGVSLTTRIQIAVATWITSLTASPPPPRQNLSLEQFERLFLEQIDDERLRKKFTTELYDNIKRYDGIAASIYHRYPVPGRRPIEWRCSPLLTAPVDCCYKETNQIVLSPTVLVPEFIRKHVRLRVPKEIIHEGKRIKKLWQSAYNQPLEVATIPRAHAVVAHEVGHLVFDCNLPKFTHLSSEKHEERAADWVAYKAGYSEGHIQWMMDGQRADKAVTELVIARVMFKVSYSKIGKVITSATCGLFTKTTSFLLKLAAEKFKKEAEATDCHPTCDDRIRAAMRYQQKNSPQHNMLALS